MTSVHEMYMKGTISLTSEVFAWKEVAPAAFAPSEIAPKDSLQRHSLQQHVIVGALLSLLTCVKSLPQFSFIFLSLAVMWEQWLVRNVYMIWREKNHIFKMLDEGILAFKWHALWGGKINVMIANQKTKIKLKIRQNKKTSMLFVQLTHCDCLFWKWPRPVVIFVLWLSNSSYN